MRYLSLAISTSPLINITVGGTEFFLKTGHVRLNTLDSIWKRSCMNEYFNAPGKYHTESWASTSYNDRNNELSRD